MTIGQKLFEQLRAAGMTRFGDFLLRGSIIQIEGHTSVPRVPGLYAFIRDHTELVYLGMSVHSIYSRVGSYPRPSSADRWVSQELLKALQNGSLVTLWILPVSRPARLYGLRSGSGDATDVYAAMERVGQVLSRLAQALLVARGGVS
jgi:hypothetical protein